jgi:hypothetical protein
MLQVDQSEQVLDGEIVDAGDPGCVALVPVTQSVRWMPKGPAVRPDPGFLTQLIATAAQAPQTRSLRRASLADAQTAYGAIRIHGIGFLTRHII